jgi:hypothetical protein
MTREVQPSGTEIVTDIYEAVEQRHAFRSGNSTLGLRPATGWDAKKLPAGKKELVETVRFRHQLPLRRGQNSRPSHGGLAFE